MQIVVLGMHRSGTSAVTGLLVKMGAYFGQPQIALPPNFDNPRGFWERIDVVSANDALLAASGTDWLTPHRYDAAQAAERTPERLKRKIHNVAAELSAQPTSVVKDPRLCITGETWLPLLSEPVCLLVLRNPLAIAKSLKSRNKLPITTGIALWEAYARAAIRVMSARPFVVFDFDELMHAPEQQSAKLHAELIAAGCRGLHAPTRSDLDASLESGLRHHTSEPSELRDIASPAQRLLLDQIQSRNFAGVVQESLSDESRAELDQMAGRGQVRLRRFGRITATAFAVMRRTTRNKMAPLLKKMDGKDT